MELLQAIQQRHSVHKFTNEKINDKIGQQLQEFIEQCNKESNCNFILKLNEPHSLNKKLFNYGDIENCKNYIILIEDKTCNEEKVGYFGQKIVLKIQQLGLNSAWLSLSIFKNKKLFKLKKDEKLNLIIAFGYGAYHGIEHKSKSIEKLISVKGIMPEWFRKGMEAVVLAPSAINQQKFKFILKENNIVKAKALTAFYSKYDLGIAKYHFEIGAGIENFSWED